MTKIDTVDIAYELERILPTSGDETISRVVDLFEWRLRNYRIELIKEFRKQNGTNYSRHRGCQRALFCSSGLLVLAFGWILYLKGVF